VHKNRVIVDDKKEKENEQGESAVAKWLQKKGSRKS